MRQGQQHRRGRTRGGQTNNHTTNTNNNNNRKGQNPISRTYQSNGPDGKVSGTASGIAEKYLSMARDATTSGDPVLAENYLQHAEHYNRIILAYRETQAIQNGADGAVQRPANVGDTEGTDDQGEDEGETYGRDMQPLPPMEIAPRPQPDQQPRAFDQPREARDMNRDGQPRDGGVNRQDNPRFDDRQPRFNDGQQRRQNNQPNQNQPRDRDDRFPRERYQAERFNNGDRGGNDRFNGQNGQNGQNNQPRPERFQNDRPRGDRPQYGDRQRHQNDRGPADRNDDRPMRDGQVRDGQVRDGQPRDAQPRDMQPRPDFIRPDLSLEPRPEVRSEARTDKPRPEMRPEMRPEIRPETRPDLRPEPRADRPELPRPNLQPRPETLRDASRPDAAFVVTASPELPLTNDQPVVPREPAVRTPRPPRRVAAPTIVAEHEQPEFLRRPVRRPRKEAAEGASPAASAPEVAAAPAPTPDREPTQD